MAKKTIFRAGRGKERQRFFPSEGRADSQGAGSWVVDARAVAEMPKIGLCKIRTERVRDLSFSKLRQIRAFQGTPSMKELTSLSNPRGLFFNLVGAVLGAKDPHTEFSDPTERKRIQDSYWSEVDRIEKRIWDAQQKKGCKIAVEDTPARDYVRGGGLNPTVINAARGRKKARIR